jgi:hypothetical protein
MDMLPRTCLSSALALLLVAPIPDVRAQSTGGGNISGGITGGAASSGTRSGPPASTTLPSTANPRAATRGPPSSVTLPQGRGPADNSTAATPRGNNPSAAAGRATTPGTRTGAPATTTSPSRTDPLADTRAPSSVTRRDTYDRLPDEPGPDYNPTAADPLGKNPSSALGPQSDFPDSYITDTRRDTLMPEADHRQLRPDSKVVPKSQRVTGGAPAGGRPAEVRRRKEETAVDTMPECVEAWDPATHISRDEWKETCDRTLEEPHL